MTDETSTIESVPTAEPFPWPPREGDSALEAFVTTWRESVFHPTSFFRRMPREENYGSVILYYIIIGVLAAGIHLFWRSVLDVSGLRDAILRALQVDPAAVHTSGLMEFLFSPIVLLLVLYVSAGLTHLFLKIVRGAKYGFDTTTRVVAFSYGPSLFNVVPYLGGLVAAIWIIVLTTIGLREAHETTTGKSISAILLPYVIILGFFFMLAILVVVIGIATAKL